MVSSETDDAHIDIDIDIDIDILVGTPRPQLPDAQAEPGFQQDYPGHRFRASADGRFVWHEIAESNSLWHLDRIRRRITGWVESAARLTLYEKGKPFASLLPFVPGPRGHCVIHAGVVSWRGRGAIIAGQGGSGKTTTALSCVKGDLTFVSEDSIVLEQRSPDAFVGHGIYNSAFVEPDHLRRFEDSRMAATAEGNTASEKHLIMLREIYPELISDSAPIEFLLLPSVQIGAPTSIRRATRPEALKQLGPNCLMTASRVDKEGFQCLVDLVATRPAYRLTLGNDLERVPELVREIMYRDG